MGFCATLFCLAILASLILQVFSSCHYWHFWPSLSGLGYISSPHFPEKYPIGDCLKWVYHGEPGTRVTLSIVDLDIPTSQDHCDNDYLIIGPIHEMKYCGNTRTQIFDPYSVELTVVQPVIYIILNSSATGIKGSGFNISYHFWSPNLTTSPSTTAIFRPTSQSTTAIFRPTTSPSTTAIFRPFRPTTSPSITAIFRPTSSAYKNTENCFYQLSDTTGHISSDQVTSGIHTNGFCSWTLYSKLTDGQKVIYFLTFETFSLFLKSRINMYDGPTQNHPLLITYTSYTLPAPVYSTGNSVVITYTPASSLRPNEKDNFTIEYAIKVDCPPDCDPCGNGEFSCYRIKDRCNGIWDCPLHGGDERGCHSSCPIDFSCDNRMPYCYTESDRCDGKGTCSNYMDEMGCTPEQCSSDKGLFLCRNGRCIYEKWKCDHTTDCTDNSDEDNCSMTSSPRVVIAAVVGSLVCSLLLVIALGCVCKVYRLRVHQLRGGPRHETPMSRQLAELFHWRAPPPPYHEAMLTSRPYDEAYLELLGQRENEANTGAGREGDNSSGVIVPPSNERSQRNSRHERRCRHSRHHRDVNQGIPGAPRARTESGGLVGYMPLLPELLEEGEGRPNTNSSESSVPDGPPPYSESDPSLHVDSSVDSGDDESSDEEASPDYEVTGYDQSNNSAHALQDQESLLNMEMTPAVRNPASLASASSVSHPRHSSDMSRVRDLEEDDSDKNAETASTSLSDDSASDLQQGALQEAAEKMNEHLVVINEDSDSDCILADDGMNDCEDADTDSDTACLLSHP